ncbi:hypothetical protein J6590_101912, partial [Homalodisca vitripennis]
MSQSPIHSKAKGYNPKLLNYSRELDAISDEANTSNQPDRIPKISKSEAYGSKLRNLRSNYKHVKRRLQDSYTKNAWSYDYNRQRRPMKYHEGHETSHSPMQQISTLLSLLPDIPAPIQQLEECPDKVSPEEQSTMSELWTLCDPDLPDIDGAPRPSYALNGGFRHA